MKTNILEFGKTEIHEGAGLPELRRGAGRSGQDYSRFNAAAPDSIRGAAAYVGTTRRELAAILEHYGF